MAMKLIIPGELPGLNEIIAESKKGRGRWQPYNDMKQEHTEKVAWIARSKIKRELGKVDLNIIWHCENRRRDKDNIMAGTKFILDGLVMAGTIKNDGWRHVGNISHGFVVDKSNPRVEVLLTEIKEVENI